MSLIFYKKQKSNCKITKNIFYIILISFAIISCVPQKKVVYFQSKDNKKEYDYATQNKKSIHIEPFDILYINIGSLDQAGYNFLADNQINSNSISEISLAVFGYTVDDLGYVNIPIIGKIKLSGLSIDEASALIAKTAKNHLNSPIVTVRFVNNTVTILGEVERPGSHTYAKGQLNIFSAIGLSGDITEYGNRRKVSIIREKDNVLHKYYLDLTKDDIFKSDYYYLKPNDIVYIEPLKIRRFGMKEYPFALIVSAVTSALLILNFFKK